MRHPGCSPLAFCNQSTLTQALRLRSRELWLEHVAWTRSYVMLVVIGLPHQNALDRLLRNQEEIGALVGGKYGPDARDAVTALLKEHIRIAGDLVSASLHGDTDVAQAVTVAWRNNANQIADALSSLNPTAWPQESMREMMRAHLDSTTKEVAAILKGDDRESVAAFAAVVAVALSMADHMSAGLLPAPKAP